MFLQRLILIDFVELLDIRFRILLGNTGQNAVILAFADTELFLKREFLAVRSHSL